MSKQNHFFIFFKKINLLINKQLKKYLNKLNSNNLAKIAKSNKVFLTFVSLIIFFLLYLSIPQLYNKAQISKQLESQLVNKFNIKFNFSKNLNYRFYPRPHFIIKDLSIMENQEEPTNIKKLFIYISFDNLFSLKNIVIKDVILENANFYFNKQNSNFFIKLLDNEFLENSLTIKNSNIFFKNFEKDVLFINKIIKMKYYYDPKVLKNIFYSKNEIFNIPYSFRLYKDKKEKKIFSIINLNFLKLQIENEIDYSNIQKKGSVNFIYNRNKSKVSYKLNKDSLNFKFFDKLINPNFFYEGNVSFKPFYSLFKGNTDKINFSNFYYSESLFSQILKTEILNNKNLNIDVNIDAKKIIPFQKVIDLMLKFRIYKGLIDIDDTKFSWSEFVDFKIMNSLLYVKENQLILDGKLTLDIKNYSEIYKFLQTSKNLRPKLNEIELDFNYNFDQQIIYFNNIKIDNKFNKKINEVLKKMIFKKNRLQNKIYFKNMMNKAIVAYSG